MNEQKQITERKIAVLVDYENTGFTTIEKLFERLLDYGRIVLKRAYADWSKASNSRNQILELGIEPVYLFRSPTKRKNTCDIRMTIDAIELLLTSTIDSFVIVSSDSDFVPLVNKLRSSGKTVYVVGEKSKAVDTPKISCDEYFEIEPNKNAQQVDIEPENIIKEKQDSLKSERKTRTATEIQISGTVEQQIDQAWSKRATVSGKSIPGPNAALDVVTILKVDRLKNSKYKTLQGILEASPLLTKRWVRNMNTIIRK